MIRELIEKNRSRRRFHQEVRPGQETLKGLVDLARLSASGANLQPLKYVLSVGERSNERVFPYLGWAGYLVDWPGPALGERPGAYIVVLGDRSITGDFGCDHGIAAQSILLGAVEAGLGGCIVSNIDRDGLSGELNLEERYEILLVIALGAPKETVVLEKVGPDGSIRYWRDSSGVHHVPKRGLEEVILKIL